MAIMGKFLLSSNSSKGEETFKKIIDLRDYLYENRYIFENKDGENKAKDSKQEFYLSIKVDKNKSKSFIQKKTKIKTGEDSISLWVSYHENTNNKNTNDKENVVVIEAKNFIPVIILELIKNKIDLEGCDYSIQYDLDYSEDGTIGKNNKLNELHSFSPIFYYSLKDSKDITNNYYKSKYGKKYNITIPYSNKSKYRRLIYLAYNKGLMDRLEDSKKINKLPRKLKKMCRNHYQYISKIGMIDNILKQKDSYSKGNQKNITFKKLYKRSKKELQKIRDNSYCKSVVKVDNLPF